MTILTRDATQDDRESLIDSNTLYNLENDGLYLGETIIANNLIVDTSLSPTSTNPVQNKVIYDIVGDIETLLYNLNSGS